MFARANSGTIVGVEAHPVIVESHRANGLPGMSLIGLARGAVKESSVRVRSALIAHGIQLGTHKLVVNLLPAELPKDASSLDLALAVSLIASGDQLPADALEGRRFCGELSLNGGIEPVHGAVLMADLARRRGDRELIVPQANAREAAIIPGIRVIGVRNLGELLLHLKGTVELPPAVAPTPETTSLRQACMSDVFGQPKAKRALEVAAAGGHNLLMAGPPGSGKTMLARRLPGLLPPLSPEERIEVTRIHSAAGLSSRFDPTAQPPFRAPHHTASEAALCGGGSVPRPGEITLAHRGVLFLDELPEFSRRALESLREPLEEGAIHIARASMSLRFPASVLLLAAMNPCPCGYFSGSSHDLPLGRSCLCAYDQIQRYRARLSGPLLDRIDMHVGVRAVPYRDFLRRGSGETSEQVRQRVLAARQRQSRRLGAARTNARMDPAEVQEHVHISEASLSLIERAMEKHGLSTRAVGRILKVARTLADLGEAEDVQAEHVEEAIDFRVLDRAAPKIESASLQEPHSDAVDFLL